MFPSKLIYAVLACLVLATSALAFNGQAIAENLLVQNASLLADMEAPLPDHVPHEVEITDAVVSLDGDLYMLIDRTFVYRVGGVCEPERPSPGDALLTWMTDRAINGPQVQAAWRSPG